jgi:phosphoesterase RecJ-like protein
MNDKISNYFDKGPIFITGHINPDGDALGASFCLKLLLDNENIDADIDFDIATSLPTNLDHLPYELITKNIKTSYETVFIFDCGNPSRLGKYENIVLKANNIIVIDHHIDPTFGTLQIVDPNAASTTQVLFRQLVKEKYKINKSMADCLLTGLITDTGRFQYPNTTTEVFTIASELLSNGADLSSISENIYGSIEFNALKLQSEIINRIEFEKDIQFTYSTIYQNDYKKYNISPEETDFMIDVVRLVKGANIALLLKEQIDGSFKGSLRSRNNFNVQEIASIFNGGGHKAASGFSSELSEQEIIEKIKNEIRT